VARSIGLWFFVHRDQWGCLLGFCSGEALLFGADCFSGLSLSLWLLVCWGLEYAGVTVLKYLTSNGGKDLQVGNWLCGRCCGDGVLHQHPLGLCCFYLWFEYHYWLHSGEQCCK